MEFNQALRSLNEHAREAAQALDAGRPEDARVQLREIQNALRHLSPIRQRLARSTDGIGEPTAIGV